VPELLQVRQVYDRIMSAVRPLEPLEVRLAEAWGCVVAEDVKAGYDIPTFASSSMDGYAVRSADLTGASPETPAVLKRVGEALIGHQPDTPVGEGEAVWIATGAPIPPGADAVAPKEDVIAEPESIQVLKPFPLGASIRPPGQDLKAGEVVVTAGRVLGGAELGMLSTAGFPTVLVHPRPRVTVVSTGDELVEPGGEPEYGKISDSNSYTILGQLKELGIEPYRTGIIPDDAALLRNAFTSNFATTDVFISSGGMSVGDRDLVAKIVMELGDISSYKVAMQPGMPQAFGNLDGRPYFGLPGNPVSVFVCFELFLRPALLKMMGRSDLERPTVDAVIQDPVEGMEERDRYVRVHVESQNGGWVAHSTGPPASHLLGTVVRANGLAVIPAGTGVVPAGEAVQVMLFRPPGQ
jgi:molybdopterin molybdotransferase